jgi:group I intron endonuclease
VYKKKYIYKIDNKVNKKSYIGQSINPSARFRRHLFFNKIENISFAEDVLKYGEDNFSLTILGEYENYNEMEAYYINKFQTIEFGYNVHKGGEEPPVSRGEDSHFSKLSYKEVQEIMTILRDTDVPFIGIAEMYECKEDAVRRINSGQTWTDKDVDYPIRDSIEVLYKEVHKLILQKIFKGDKTLKQISAELGVSYSRVKAINNGQNRKNEDYRYPLQENVDYNKAVSTISLIGE